MNEDSAVCRGRARTGHVLVSFLLQLAVPVGFFAVVFAFVPLIDRFEMNMDEGIELMKGLLFARGHALYADIWSNQTPLFTMVLGGLFNLVGEQVLAARTLVLASSALLLWAAFQTLRTGWGTFHAFVGAAFLVLLPVYVRLSVLAMAGLPAVSLAVLALLFLVYWHDGRRDSWLILSAVTLGLSVLIKAFTGFLFFVFLSGILASALMKGDGARRISASLRPALVWTAVFTAVTLIPAVALIGPEHRDMLTGMHEAARGLEFYEQFDLYSQIEGAQWLMLVALLAIPFAASSRRWASLYLAGWLAAAYLVLYFHIPVWSHHTLLLTVPAAMLAGIGVGEAAGFLRKSWPFGNLFSVPVVLAALVLLSAVANVAQTTPRLIDEVRVDAATERSDERAHALVDEIRALAPDTQWMFTDDYQYAFRAGLPVPPGLASISDMQLRTGAVTEAQIIETIEAYEPEQILIARFELPMVRRYAAEEYDLVHEEDGKLLFVREDLEERR